MGLFKSRKVQAMGEGGKDNMDLENALYATTSGETVGGTTNKYKTYSSQVNECYRKYNGEATWGNQQTRAVLDIRSAFISGGGVTIASSDDKFNAWYEKFLVNNRILSSRFFDIVLGTEITGKALLTMAVKPGEYPRVLRIPYHSEMAYKVVLEVAYDPSSVIDVTVDKGGVQKSLGLSNFVYIRTGGDDRDVNCTTTKTGIVLNETENYDRALKDLRRTNHVVSRITPTFETAGEKETKEVADNLRKSRWRIGKAFVGTAKFAYKSPGTGSVDNLKSEMATSIKTISAVTGAPVHWIGWTDLMSNRSTADSLYETLKNATVRERSLISDGLYDLIVKAQELYIDNGGTGITEVTRDFSVSIPIIDMTEFVDLVKGLSTAYADGVISKMDYQNSLPGIDPLKTNQAIEKEQKDNLEKEGVNNNNNGQEDDND